MSRYLLNAQLKWNLILFAKSLFHISKKSGVTKGRTTLEQVYLGGLRVIVRARFICFPLSSYVCMHICIRYPEPFLSSTTCPSLFRLLAAGQRFPKGARGLGKLRGDLFFMFT